MNYLSKIFICFLVLSIFCTSIVVAAESSTLLNTSENQEKSPLFSVYAHKNSSYMVNIPKLIVFNNIPSFKYTVSLTGDISGTENILVEPAKSVIMKEQNNDIYALNASAEQNKTVWTCHDIASAADGTVTSTRSINGIFSGTLTFFIKTIWQQ